MSKPSSEKSDRWRQTPEKGRRVNRIPDLEWLFTNEGKKKESDGFLKKLLRSNWAQVLASVLLYVLQAAPAWIMPLITGDVIDMITYRPEGYILRIVVDGIILTVLLVQNVPTTAWRLSITNRLIRGTTASIKSGVVRKLQRLSITYHKEMEEGKIHSKFLRDIENVDGYFRTYLTVFLPGIVGVIVSVVISLIKSPIVTLFFVAVVPLNVLLMVAFRRRIRKDNYVYRQETEKLSGKLTNTLQMMSLTKAHGLINEESNAVNEKIDSVTNAGLKLDKTNAWFGSLAWVFSQLLAMLCLFFCVFLALKDYVTPGEVVLFQSLFGSISNSVMTLINVYPSLTSGQESVRSLSEIVCAEDIERDDGAGRMEGIEGRVDFCNVSYHYPNEEKAVVKNIELHVAKGERIAVVGSSGSGKSTLMNLIIGLLSPTEGEILIDGTPLTELPLQAYRHFLSVVPQNSILFSGSIRENITYGLDSYSEEELQRVVEDADISEFLPSLSNGLDSQVGEHGDKLSGGQKQRVSIARALIRDPKILIMDEATSALDNVAEFHVQRAIDRLVRERTTFIVAHRLSTIRNAHRIVVMEEGEMVEIGTYDELMAKGGKFSELERLSRIREGQVRDEVS